MSEEQEDIQKRIEALLGQIAEEHAYFYGLDNHKEAFEYFKAKHAVVQLLWEKQKFLNSYQSWNIADIENELKIIESYFNVGYGPGRATNSEQELYNRLESQYYLEHKMPHEYTPVSGLLAVIFGRYTLFHHFLISKLNNLYDEGNFSKLSQNGKIDTILAAMHNWSGYEDFSIKEMQTILKKDNLVVKNNIIAEILVKLEKDSNARITKTDPEMAYAITFEGRFFHSQNGYQGEYERDNQAKNHAEQVERAMWLNNKWLKIGTLIAGIATSCLVLIEILKIALNNQHYPKVIEIATFFFVFFAGTITGILALLIILHVLSRKNIE